MESVAEGIAKVHLAVTTFYFILSYRIRIKIDDLGVKKYRTELEHYFPYSLYTEIQFDLIQYILNVEET